MLRILVTYTADDAKKIKAFYETVNKEKIVATTRREEGCLRYDYYFSADRDNEILLVEEWESKDAQQLHMTKPHMARLATAKEKHGVASKLTILE